MSSFNSNNKLNQDPDYFEPLANKNNENICEKNALSTAKRISAILETEFSKEIDAKKKEIFKIYETLDKACKTFHYLRYAIVTDYYNKVSTTSDPETLKQTRPHPTVNALTKEIDITIDCKNDCYLGTNECNQQKRKIESEPTELKESNEPKRKIFKGDLESLRLGNRKFKIRVVVGNYSKWIPPHSRESNDATHKWTVYVIDSQKTDLGNFVSKVRFFLHPSYQPNDVVELTSSPFHLSRLGWGEFPIRVQLHFTNNINKPVDIIHNLKLDRTYTGLLTIGSETVADIWLVVTEKLLPFIEERKLDDDCLLGDEATDLNVKEPVNEEKDEDLPSTINNETCEDNVLEQNGNENVEDTITILSDHDYIRTNFVITKSESKTNVSEKSLSNIKSNSKSLLKSNHGNTSCTITINKGKIISSNQNHNFDELPLEANLKNESETSKHYTTSNKFNKEQYYTDPGKYAPDKKHAKILRDLMKLAKPKDLFSILRLIIRRIPIITEKAKDEQYKLMFPYSCESYQVFSNYSLAKQHACERYRALHALDIMRDVHCFESSCSVKELMTWARRYGYTPIINLKTLNKLSTASKTINVEEVGNNYDNSTTFSTELNNWLLKCQNLKPSIQRVVDDSDDEIDVISIESRAPNPLSYQKDSQIKETNVILLNHPEKYNSLNEFVSKTTEKIGIKLTNEEIIPRVSHSSASLVISKALECLVDELTRSALACAIDKRCAEKNVEDFKVEVDDVHKALLKREEFDIFTNAGLGSEG